MQVGISRDEMLLRFQALGDGVPDSVQYQEFCSLHMEHPLAAEMAEADPFSKRYAALAMRLYLDLRGREGSYDPARDEDSGLRGLPNIWTEVIPWSFRDPKLVSEFLASWSQIMRCLEVEAGWDASVLEYGTGSGQLLLMLARLGLQTHAVDIDEGSLAQVRAQSDAMGLDVRTERAGFGEGFEGKTFDRILFFEAFHHAIDFMPLLTRLQQRLKPGGRLIFCGEPILGERAPSVPYPWGPRLDALSIFCMRKWGWMELGFTERFFVEALQRRGWVVEHRPSADCGRANAYVARSYVDQPLAIGAPLNLGSFSPGWHGGEGGHRWTSGVAAFPLPDDPCPKDIRVRLFNPLPIDRVVTLSAGTSSIEILISAATDAVDAFLLGAGGSNLMIACEGIQPDRDLGIPDTRILGIAVREIEVTTMALVGSARYGIAPGPAPSR